MSDNTYLAEGLAGGVADECSYKLFLALFQWKASCNFAFDDLVTVRQPSISSGVIWTRCCSTTYMVKGSCLLFTIATLVTEVTELYSFSIHQPATCSQRLAEL